MRKRRSYERKKIDTSSASCCMYASIAKHTVSILLHGSLTLM